MKNYLEVQNWDGYIYIYIYNTIIKMFKFVSTLILISYSLERPCDAC